MTTQEIINYYANLLIIQYIGKPKAYATIQSLVAMVVMDQLPQQVQDAFTIGTAEGVQLDILGEYVGVTRYAHLLNNSPITLNDDQFTKLIQLAAIKNNAGSSLADIQNLLQAYFANEIFVYDGADMQLSYLIAASVGDIDLIQVFIKEGLLPKPMGVELAAVIYIPVEGLFGMVDYFTTYNAWSSSTTYQIGNQVFENGIIYSSIVANNLNHAVTDSDYWTARVFPFNTYADYNETWTWLSYEDTIPIT